MSGVGGREGRKERVARVQKSGGGESESAGCRGVGSNMT